LHSAPRRAAVDGLGEHALVAEYRSVAIEYDEAFAAGRFAAADLPSARLVELHREFRKRGDRGLELLLEFMHDEDLRVRRTAAPFALRFRPEIALPILEVCRDITRPGGTRANLTGALFKWEHDGRPLETWTIDPERG
jgi:hypothetical protein